MTTSTAQPLDSLYRERPENLFSCWQSLSIHPGVEARLVLLERTCARLLLYNQLFSRHGIQPKGILYLGANIGQLLWVWILMGFRHIFMAEPQKEAFLKLEQWTERSAKVLLAYESFTQVEDRVQIHLSACGLGDRDGTAHFYRTSNSNLSSLLNPELSCQDEYSRAIREHMKVREVLQIPIRRMDTLFQQSNGSLCVEDFNAVYMNLQGAELLALKGMSDSLEHFDFLYLENNFISRYKDCPKADELNQFLKPFGFRPIWGQFNKIVGNGFTAYAKG